jgi:recombination protein RecR
MEYPSNIIHELVEKFSKLPGIGKRTSLRMVLNLLKQEEKETLELSDLLIRLKKDIKYCRNCHAISDTDICQICSDEARNQQLICIVEDQKDLIAIENTRQFSGVYHVLGGLISPIDGIGPEKLAIDSLIARIKECEAQELIFALRATMEGDTTMFYISKQIQDQSVKLSAISRGISIGGELEFADEITLGRSIVNRTNYTT